MIWFKFLPCLAVALMLFSCTTPPQPVDADASAAGAEQKELPKDKFFIMGIGMYRLNWSDVEGDEVRFEYSDLGLPADFSTTERASFVLDGTLGHGAWQYNGFLNYDPDNRVNEPDLEFLFSIKNDYNYLSVGDHRNGAFSDYVFSRYHHPFRGLVLGHKDEDFSVELLGGKARGESQIDELAADQGSGPYYTSEVPVISGSDTVFLIIKSASQPDVEISRTLLVRNQDYFIDYDRGSLLFNETLYPFDSYGNPVFLVISYQYESLNGHFSRYVYGVNSAYAPFDSTRITFSYIGDSDGTVSLGDAFDERRDIFTLGLQLDFKHLKLLGEVAMSEEQGQDRQNAFFGGLKADVYKNIALYLHSWGIDALFSTFANNQLDYGYSLSQILPETGRTFITLSPFQFGRNIHSELFPFSQSTLMVDEQEFNGFVEYQGDSLTISGGMGQAQTVEGQDNDRLAYVSSFYNGTDTKAWGKVEWDRAYDDSKAVEDSDIKSLLAGIRQRLTHLSKGDVYVQAEYQVEDFTDDLDLMPDTTRHNGNCRLEYLVDDEGVYVGYTKEILRDKDGGKLADVDITEAGIRGHVYKGLFLDSRYREEKTDQEQSDTTNRILSLGGGYETTNFRTMVQYEQQLNRSNNDENRRKLWSVFVFGSPFKGLSINVRYYKQTDDSTTDSLEYQAEEELNARLIWRLARIVAVYSQWRYNTFSDTFLKNSSQSNSLACVQGVKINATDRLDFLGNYKLLKVWGPLENRRESLTAEVGYLIYKHLRLGVGYENIQYQDVNEPENDYDSHVGYFKIVTVF